MHLSLVFSINTWLTGSSTCFIKFFRSKSLRSWAQKSYIIRSPGAFLDLCFCKFLIYWPAVVNYLDITKPALSLDLTPQRPSTEYIILTKLDTKDLQGGKLLVLLLPIGGSLDVCQSLCVTDAGFARLV